MCVLFICVFLWEIECTHCKRKDAWEFLGSSFSHRAHRVNRAFLRTFRAHRGPPAYRVHRAFLLTLGWKLWEVRRSRTIKNPYNPPSWPLSTHAYIIAYNRGCNQQEISVLRFAFEYMPFLLVEDALLDARKACSWMQKGMFLFLIRPFLECRKEQPVKYLDIFCLHG